MYLFAPIIVLYYVFSNHKITNDTPTIHTYNLTNEKYYDNLVYFENKKNEKMIISQVNLILWMNMFG